jgi:putative two-component system response regulator
MVKCIEQAATLHDVGKIGIPDEILRKPARLTEDEWTVMKNHTRIGRLICDPDADAGEVTLRGPHAAFGTSAHCTSRPSVMAVAGRIALTHHERWDGTGYPTGLAGLQIPIEGRITAVADAFDAMSSRRPYKPALPVEVCYTLMENERARQFDPNVLDALFAERSRVESIRTRYSV